MGKIIGPAFITAFVYVIWIGEGLSIGFSLARTPEQLLEDYYGI